MFVLSPQGVGMDCHRTWESILLVIWCAKHSQLDGLYKLACHFGDRWSDVNQDLLKNLSEMIYQSYLALFLQHWAEK